MFVLESSGLEMLLVVGSLYRIGNGCVFGRAVIGVGFWCLKKLFEGLILEILGRLCGW